jgi:tRNA nucleotidyltransferase (CCA-adding enzyme)
MVTVPSGPAFLINALEAAGYEAWAVGGCVRDSLLGLVPHDWDITTSAKPEQTLAVFRDQRVIETGLKHGTVTVIWEGAPYEVTTYRTDGLYTDSRRPDSVTFVSDLKEDLSRRDFTVNAMAYHPQRGLYDAFGGAEDLKSRSIRCVGDPRARFEEDALRILRALRFAATYGFTVEEKTAQSLMDCRERLHVIAPERIREEFMRLLAGPGAAGILRDFAPVFDVFLPELTPMRGFSQFNPYHHLDVWEHTLQSVDAAPRSGLLRLVMLLHDSGKPARFFRDDKGIGHFYGHPQTSMKLAQDILTRLRFDNRTRHAVEELVLWHDVTIPAKEKNVRRWLNRLGEERLTQLVAVKRADASAQNPSKRDDKLRMLDELEACLSGVLQKGLPYTLKGLAVTGQDLQDAGIPPGKRVGQVLDVLLKQVMDGRIPNEKAALLHAAQKLR